MEVKYIQHDKPEQIICYLGFELFVHLFTYCTHALFLHFMDLLIDVNASFRSRPINMCAVSQRETCTTTNRIGFVQ